jgi:peptide/nickel transport system permease protein
MTAYIIRRLIQTFIVVNVLAFVCFGLMGLMPGDPLDIACQSNPNCTPENLEQMKKNLGLDRPIIERYGKWLVSFVSGDLGYSRTYRRPVTEILGPRLVNTMILSGISLFLSIIVAIPLGVFSSLYANSKADYSLNFMAFLGISVPSFWLGLMLIIIFSVYLGWFPAGGTETIGLDKELGFWGTVFDRMKYLTLPVISLSAQTIASWIRYTRASMLETMRNDYIRTARAKGLKFSQVVRRHGLRNALIPVVTVIALSFSTIFSGAVITENVFAYQGAGKLIFDSIFGNDFNVAMCSFIITTLAVLVMNLVADILYAYLDPRISYQ